MAYCALALVLPNAGLTTSDNRSACRPRRHVAHAVSDPPLMVSDGTGTSAVTVDRNVEREGANAVDRLHDDVADTTWEAVGVQVILGTTIVSCELVIWPGS